MKGVLPLIFKSLFLSKVDDHLSVIRLHQNGNLSVKPLTIGICDSLNINQYIRYCIISKKNV